MYWINKNRIDFDFDQIKTCFKSTPVNYAVKSSQLNSNYNTWNTKENSIPKCSKFSTDVSILVQKQRRKAAIEVKSTHTNSHSIYINEKLIFHLFMSACNFRANKKYTAYLFAIPLWNFLNNFYSFSTWKFYYYFSTVSVMSFIISSLLFPFLLYYISIWLLLCFGNCFDIIRIPHRLVDWSKCFLLIENFVSLNNVFTRILLLRRNFWKI